MLVSNLIHYLLEMKPMLEQMLWEEIRTNFSNQGFYLTITATDMGEREELAFMKSIVDKVNQQIAKEQYPEWVTLFRGFYLRTHET
jgi:hypothetical protein